MVRALELALKGGRSVAPNPMVGAVLAYEGAVIGEGYHQRYGGPHAEVAALSSVEDRSLIPHSTLYVTLEPCAHFGKTPPCADLIIDSGIKRVVIGCRDPFPQVSGRGIERLINAGISVTEGVMELECRAMNRRFIVAQREKRPYCILKWAQTRDGFIARADLSSRWISSAPARTLTHLWRSQEMAILVGRTTAAVDDPELTVRHAIGQNPVRIVIDPTLSLPQTLKLFNGATDTIILNTVRESTDGPIRFRRIDPLAWSCQALCSTLFQEGLTSIIVEGGALTLRSFIDAEIWDEARIFISATTFGAGIKAPSIPQQEQEQEQGQEQGGHMCTVGTDTLITLQHPLLAARLGITTEVLQIPIELGVELLHL